MHYDIFFSTTGMERVMGKKGKWVKVQPGHYLSLVMGPVLEGLRKAEEQKSMGPFREQLNKSLPSPPFFNYREKYFFATGLLQLVLSLQRARKEKLKARLAFVETEQTAFQKIRERKTAFPALPWVQGSWRKCDIYPEIVGRQLGFRISAPTVFDAAMVEAALMVMFNVRKLKICPDCLQLHWGEREAACLSCRRKKDRERKGQQVRTAEDRFLNKLAQNLARGNLTKKQVKKLKEILQVKGLAKAEEHYQEIRKSSRPNTSGAGRASDS